MLLGINGGGCGNKGVALHLHCSLKYGVQFLQAPLNLKGKNMKKLIAFILFCCLICASTCEAQLFGRRSNTYETTPYGYNYKGKQYILGVDGPVSATCPCPMCQQLRAALAARQPVDDYIVKPKEQDVYTQDIATPEDAIIEMLNILNPEHGSVLLDPGCGDARILIYGANSFNTRGIGLEINKETYENAVREVEKNGLSKRINLYNVDSTTKSFVNADNVALFLFPSLIAELTPKFLELKSGAKVISYQHTIPLPGVKKIDDFYIWTKE